MPQDQARTNETREARPEPGIRAALKGALLVHVPTEGDADALHLAIPLAQASGGVVHAVIAEGFEPAALGGTEFTSGSLLQALLDAQRRRIAATLARTVQERASTAVPMTIDQEELFPEVALGQHAAGADWIVMVRPPEAGVHALHADVSAVLLKTGSPVLLAPSAAQPLRAARVIVAWRDSREARRAVADAMPVLQAAGEVLVVSASPQDRIDYDRLSLERLVARLRLRGCKAGCELHQTDGGLNVPELLEKRACAIGADLIVAGAYAHSRAGEWIFGGVTRSLINACPVYLLMSH